MQVSLNDIVKPNILSNLLFRVDCSDMMFVRASILERTPFMDKSFDVSISSYVAHGLKLADRKLMYSEMNRITKNIIIIYDYNQTRSIWIDLIIFVGQKMYKEIRMSSKTKI